jgi:non-heme chloroperoxidase
MPLAPKSVLLSTGVRLPYVEQGDPAGVPVLLLHGYTDSWRSFEPLLAKLPDHVHAYAITQRGHGDADRPPSGYRPEDFAADAAAFLDAVGLDAAVIAGHSAGSYTAQRFAIDHPDRTLGLVLIGAFRTFRDNPGIQELWHAVSRLADPIDPGFVREFQHSTITQPVPPPFLERIIADSQKVPARVWKHTLRGLLDAAPPTDTATIAALTLILWGDRDDLCPHHEQQSLAAAIPNSHLIAYPGTGHAVHWEQPARAAADLTALAAPLATATPTRGRRSGARAA